MPSSPVTVAPPADIVIVGGGLVGSCLAIALEPLNLRVVMLEAHAGTGMPPVFDQRNLSFNAATVNALTALGVMPLLAAPSGPIRRIETSRVGDFGRVVMQASDYGRSEFGRVVIASDLGRALEQRLSALKTLTRIRPARFTATSELDGVRQVHYIADGAEQVLPCQLLVGADGATSGVRSALAINTTSFDYRHDLFVAAARLDRPLNGAAFERISDHGPLALLPRGDGQVGLIVGVDRADADRVMAMADAEYLQYVQDRFGYRAGRLISVGERSRYAGRRDVATALTAPHAVLVGNAAQSLHPVGAQGFNLGLRDALTLAEGIAAAASIGDATMLQQYVQRRREDRERTLAFSHTMATLGTNPLIPLRPLRTLGMALVGRVQSVKDRVVAQAMGLGGDVPELCRDLP